MKVKVWGVRNMKKTEKTDHSTGVKTTEKRCTGVIEFPVLAIEAGQYEDKEVVILTVEEYQALQSGEDLIAYKDYANRVFKACVEHTTP